MPYNIVETFQDRPSVARYMARAFLPSAGLREGGELPRIRECWNTIRIDRRHLRTFIEMTGLPAGGGISLLQSPDAAASLLYPHVFGFPLQMALLTHRDFPLPIWGVLQIRNHMLLHRPFSEYEALNLETRAAGQRILAKGLEVDLHSTLSALGERVWEGLTTFYYRGHFGPGQESSPLAKPLPGDWPVLSCWRMPRGTGWRFAGLTGDYNGIHWQKLVRAAARLQGAAQPSSIGDRTMPYTASDAGRSGSAAGCMAERAGLLRHGRLPAGIG